MINIFNMMLYIALITVAIIANGGSVHSAPALGSCDTLEGVNAWHHECSDPLRPDVKGGSMVDTLAAYCSQEETYVDCMETKVLDHHCHNYAIIMLAVRNTMEFCVNGDVADWITDASFVDDEHCVPQAGEVIRGCFEFASKQSPYGFNIGGLPFATGFEESNRFKDRTLTCVRAELENTTSTTSGPGCTATSWQSVYNLFALGIASHLTLGMQLQEGDIINPTGNGMETELKRALLPDTWRHRKSTV